MNRIATKCRDVLEAAYGERFAGLVLYGSAARSDAQADSDLDLLVLLNGHVDFFRELRVITDLLYPVQLESERLVSAKPVPVDEYRTGSLQLYRNALREGVSL